MEIYRWLVILCGFLVIGYTTRRLLQSNIDLNFILIVLFTTFVATQISIKFPSFNGTITVSDAFIFITLLVWGGPAAVFLSVVEAITLTYRLKAKFIRTYLFNISSSALTTWTSAIVLFYTFGRTSRISQELPLFSFVLAMCLLALTYFVSNMVLTAIMQMLKMDVSQWKTWSRYYLWTCVTFFFGAALAGIFIKLAFLNGVVAVLLIAPIAIVLYLAYTSYIRTVDALQASESRFRSSFDYATIGMGIVTPEGKWLQVNKSLSQIFQLSEQELLASDYQTLLHPENSEEVYQKVNELTNREIPAFQIETRFVNKEGADVWVMLGVSTAHDANGNIRHLIFQIQDITSRRQAEEKLWFDANHDALTGLPNRAAFTARLAEIVEKKKNLENPLFATLFLDLDGFKIVNDSLGHAAGDELLKGVSERLLECIRGNDMVARLGGDEFTVLLVNLKDISQAIIVAERIRSKITKAFHLEGQEVFISTSIGIATSEIKYEKADEMLRDADAAMYQAKAQGKGCYSIFDHEMHSNAIRLLHLANDLRRAIERSEFVIQYQPIKSLKSDKITGFEALVRWNHPTYGMLSPFEFIPLAEENGLISQIDNWVMLNACRQMKKWQTDYAECADLNISVNISSRQFAQTGLFNMVKDVLMETELKPTNLQLEITESAMIKSLKNTASILKELNFLGIKIALDDFGTGYSSLNYLHELPISVLKIDRAFVARLENEKEGLEILKAIIALASSLKMEIVAEGIETLEQLELLKEIGCASGQGFYLSRPVNADEAIEIFLLPTANYIPKNAKLHRGLRLVNM